jgi:hypothetical protein
MLHAAEAALAAELHAAATERAVLEADKAALEAAVLKQQVRLCSCAFAFVLVRLLVLVHLRLCCCACGVA